MTESPPPYPAHGRAPRVGILLTNLGTPDAPTASAVRRYLAEFLSDRRVVEIPPLVWKIILHGIILRTRPAKSAKKYASVWTSDGSPLLVWTQRQAQYLRGALGEKIRAMGLPSDLVKIEVGMRYGNPSIASALSKLKAENCDRILVLPMYPQYAASTTATACDEVFRALTKERYMPALRTITSWHDNPNYIKALAGRITDFWGKHGRPDKLLMSFHGVPKFSLLKGDPYHCLCHVTARLLARELGLTESQWVLTFQSRFGKAEWVQPYTEATLKALPAQGVKRLHVVCPGFPADCLETLEEIAMEGKETFLHAGGAQYDYIPALNDHDSLIHALTELSLANLQGWLNAPPSAADLQAQVQRAKALGAKDSMLRAATITRRSALKRIGAVSSAPVLAALGGCAEFEPGYPPSAMPRFAPVQWPEGRERTALVLGSGGPRGFAHIGVLKVLETAGIEPALVVGSSAGAIAGALYASKIAATEIERRALDLGLPDIADPALMQPNRLIGRALQNFVNTAVDDRVIEQLPRRFCAVAAVLGKPELIAFTSGNTGAAVRASAALPSMFLPTPIGGVTYEDGDLVSPVPIRIARQLGATRVVAVDVSAFLEDTPERAPESWRKRDEERRVIIDAEAKEADFLLRVRLPYYAGASREYRENLIRLATAQTRDALAQFRTVLA